MKLRTLSALLAVCFGLTATAGAAAPVAWWKLDDNAASATVADSSGNNRSGTFYSGLSTQNTSIAHSADRPEGSGSLDCG